MLGLSIWKILIIAGIVMILFGKGKISEVMGDVAKGIKSFKKGMAEPDDDLAVIDHSPQETLASARVEEAKRA
jgi:sec-independent protein translocase protein TatA